MAVEENENEQDPCRTKLFEISKLGKEISKDVAAVCLYDLQSATQGFRGFTMDEVIALCEFFPVVSFEPEVQIIEAGDESTFTAIILQGNARTFHTARSLEFVQKTKRIEKEWHILHRQLATQDKETTLDHLQKGDFIGQIPFLTSLDVHVPHSHCVTLTGAVNSLILISHFQLKRLNKIHPQVGNQMVRLIAEAAASRVFAPSGSLPTPAADPDATKPEIKPVLHRLQNQKGTILHGLTNKEMDCLLEHGELVQYSEGDLVFCEGHQARIMLLLLTGGLETKIGFRRQGGEDLKDAEDVESVKDVKDAEDVHCCESMHFTTPGDIVGECLFPHIIHKKDTFASQNSLFLAITLSNIRNLNVANPALGLKFTQRIIQNTLNKMNHVFQPGGLAYNSEWMEPAEKERELAMMRWICTDGMHKLLRSAVAALTMLGEGRPTLAMEVHDLEGRAALLRLTEILATLGSKIYDKNVKMSKMIPKKEIQSVQHKVGRLTIAEFELRKLVREKEYYIQTLETKSHDELKDALEECARLKRQLEMKNGDIWELQANMEEQKQHAHAEWKRIYDENFRLKKQLHTSSSAKNDELWNSMAIQYDTRIKEMQKEIAKLQDSNLELKRANTKLNFQSSTLEEELTRVKRTSSVVSGDSVEVKKDKERRNTGGSDLSDAVGDFDEIIPRLQAELKKSERSKSMLRWYFFARLLLKRNKYRPAIREESEISTIYRKQLKTMSEDNTRLKTMSDVLQKRATKAEREREECKQLSMVCTDDVDSLSQLCSLLVYPVLESTAKREPVKHCWQTSDVETLQKSWEILSRRHCLSSTLESLDINAIGSVLSKSGKDSDNESCLDHLADLLITEPKRPSGLERLLSRQKSIQPGTPKLHSPMHGRSRSPFLERQGTLEETNQQMASRHQSSPVSHFPTLIRNPSSNRRSSTEFSVERRRASFDDNSIPELKQFAKRSSDHAAGCDEKSNKSLGNLMAEFPVPTRAMTPCPVASRIQFARSYQVETSASSDLGPYESPERVLPRNWAPGRRFSIE